jgi:hypothetical protein
MVLGTSYAALDRGAILNGEASGASSSLSCPTSGEEEG